MTAIEMMKLLGRKATWSVAPTVDVEVTITNVKRSYGETRVEITPTYGKGKTWVLLNTIYDLQPEVNQARYPVSAGCAMPPKVVR